MKRCQYLIIALFCILFTSMVNAQTYTFDTNTGVFESSEGWSVKSYSGYDLGHDGYNYKNQSGSEGISNLGTIPRGMYYITNVTSSITANTIVLSPDSSNDMNGRGGFRIHGDNSRNNASQGCIILSATYREKIAKAFYQWKQNGKTGPVLTLQVY